MVFLTVYSLLSDKYLMMAHFLSGQRLLYFAALVLLPCMLFAGPNFTTYQAKIIKPDGYPLQEISVNFKFSVLDPAGTCNLYSETFSNINMSNSSGLISFSLGSGIKTFPSSGSTTFSSVFSNSAPSLSCEAGGPGYSPAADDTRKLVMQFYDGNGWQTLPAMDINAVPYAMYANEAQTLSGLPSCNPGEALSYNGASFSCEVIAGGGVTSATIAAALGYTPTDSASFAALVTSVASESVQISSVSSTVSSLAIYSATVSSSVYSVSAAVTSLSNTVAASFAAITSSQWLTSGTSILFNSGRVGIGGISTPATALDVSGGVRIGIENSICATNLAGTLRYNSGLVEYCNGTSWSAFGASGAGILAFNGLTSGSQTIAFGSAGNFPNVSSTGTVHTFNFPFASAATTTAGVISNLDYTTFWNKLDATDTAIISALGYTPANVVSLTTLSSNLDAVSSAVSSLAASTAVSFSAISSITNLNGSTSATQSFAIGVTGTGFNVISNNGIHTFSIPLASGGAVAAGLISNADYLNFANKVTSSAASIAAVLGYVPASSTALGNYLLKSNNLSDLASVATARDNLGLGGFATISSLNLASASATGILDEARLPSFTNITSGAQYSKVTVDGKGRVTSGSGLSLDDVTTALGFTPASASASTQWNTSGTTINYLAGDVGIGTDNPLAGLHVVKNNGAGIAAAFQASSSLGYVTLGSTVATGSFVQGLNNSGSVGTLSLNTMGGNVGIGTATPREKLDIAGVIYSQMSNGPILYVGDQSSSGTPTLSDGFRMSYDADLFGANNDGLVFEKTDFNGNTPDGGIMFANRGMNNIRVPAMVIQGTGFVGVGTASPTAQLHLAAGTMSAAPFKFTSGTLLSSPQSGTMEYDGVQFYFTDGANIRRTIATGSVPGTIDNASTINSTGSINLFPNSGTGSVFVSSILDSTNSTNGALVVLGGLGIAGNINTAGNLNVSGSSVVNGSLSLSAMASGSILFAGASGAVTQDNSNLFWDGTNKQLGIGTSAPTSALEVSIDDAVSDGLTTILTLTHTTTGSAAPGIGPRMAFKAEKSTGLPASMGYIGAVFTDVTNGAEDADLVFAPLLNSTGQGTERLRITSSGFVGIGTSAPVAVLEVSSTGGETLLLRDNNNLVTENAFSSYIRSRDSSGSLGWFIGDGSGSNNALSIMNYLSAQLYFGTSGTTRMTIDSSGNVGVGTTIPNYKLDVSGTLNIASGSALAFGGTSVCTAAGCTSSSDMKLKENIEPLAFDLNKLLSVKAVQYDWKNKEKYGDKHQIGFIAQELEKVYPEIVYTDKNTGLKSVAYGHLVVPIVEALKTFYKRLIEVEYRNAAHDRQMASIVDSKADKAEIEDLRIQNSIQKIRSDKLEAENQALKEYLCSKDPGAPICK